MLLSFSSFNVEWPNIALIYIDIQESPTYKELSTLPGGVCSCLEDWNKNYLCIDHYHAALSFGCYSSKCYLQCQWGEGKWCYSEENIDGEWKTRPCKDHKDCLDVNLICRDEEKLTIGSVRP